MRGLAVAAACVGLVAAAAAGAQARKKGEKPATFAADGVRATVHLNGDESRLHGGVGASTACTKDTLVLVVQGEYGTENVETYRALEKAIRAGDKLGIEEMERAGRLVRVKEGTPVLVVDHFLGREDWMGLIPAWPVGTREVRVLEGPEEGRTGWLSARNLRVEGVGPPESPKGKAKAKGKARGR